MPLRGVHFAIDNQTLFDLIKLPYSERADFVSNNIEENWEANFATETDKAWALIHSALQRSNPEADGLERSFDDACSWVILGREYIEAGDGFVIGLIESHNVGTVARYLKDIDTSDIIAQLKLNIAHFECTNVGVEDAEYAGSWFPKIKEFFAKAADAGRNVIFTVDF
jgi:hypothetical protein